MGDERARCPVPQVEAIDLNSTRKLGEALGDAAENGGAGGPSTTGSPGDLAAPSGAGGEIDQSDGFTA